MELRVGGDVGCATDVTMGSGVALGTPKVRTHYLVECHDAAGALLWREEFHNLVTTAGFNILLDSTLKTGVASPTWFVGLVDNASFSAYAAADTMASHAGWIEFTAYSEATRQAFTPSVPSGGSCNNSAAKAVFTANGPGTVRGCFLANNNTKSGTTGTLYGEGDFGAAQPVIATNVLSVTVTPSVS